MWKRLRHWLGKPNTLSAQDEDAPRIEPGLDAPLPLDPLGGPPADTHELRELGDAYESPLVSSSAVIELPPTQPDARPDAPSDAPSQPAPSARPARPEAPSDTAPGTPPTPDQPDQPDWGPNAPPATDALPEASPVSIGHTSPQAPLWPDELWRSPSAEAPAAQAEVPTAGEAADEATNEVTRDAADGASATRTQASASQDGATNAERIEPVLSDIAPVFTVAPAQPAPALPEITPQADPSHRQEPRLDSASTHSWTDAWADSRLEPGLDGALPQADTPNMANTDTGSDTPGFDALTLGAVDDALATPKPAPASTPAIASPITPPIARPISPPLAPPAPQPPAAITAPAPLVVDDEPVLVHVLATMRDASPPRFDCLSQQHWQHGDAEMAAHMQGLTQYVQGRNPVEMTPRRHALWRHLQRVHHLWALSVMPAELDALGLWAGVVNAVVALPDGSVRDPKGYVILAGPGGRDDALARLPHPADALQRKQRTEALLQARGWHTPGSLPPVAGQGEIERREAVAVMGRALAVLLVAVRAESLAEGGAQALTPDKLRHKLPAAFEHLTPHEAHFVHTATPSDSQVVAMGWRYEALNVLLWALGLVDELSWPAQVCDVAHCVSLLVNVNADPDALVQDSMLRPRADILDQLDLHMRLHWLLRDAELHGKPGPDVSRGVVMERHHALNWLIGFERAPWDKVSTAT
jgi:hypothetical protein